MIPDPPTVETPIYEGGPGGQARDDACEPSRAGHLCICGQPLEESLRDLWVFASPTSLAYLPCLFSESLAPGSTARAATELLPPSAKVVGADPGGQDT